MANSSSSSSDELRSALLALDRATFYARFAALAVRPDGREAAACRATSLRTRVLSDACADGSASVRLGATALIASVSCVARAAGAAGVSGGEEPARAAVGVSVLLPEVRGGRTTCAASSPQAAELASFLAGLFNAAGCLDAASLDVAAAEEGGEAGGGGGAAAGAMSLEAEGADAADADAAPRRRRRGQHFCQF